MVKSVETVFTKIIKGKVLVAITQEIIALLMICLFIPKAALFFLDSLLAPTFIRYSDLWLFFVCEFILLTWHTSLNLEKITRQFFFSGEIQELWCLTLTLSLHKVLPLNCWHPQAGPVQPLRCHCYPGRRSVAPGMRLAWWRKRFTAARLIADLLIQTLLVWGLTVF